jgi:hypothetical protein
VWKYFKHPNLLPLLGVEMTEDRFMMVSEWMTNGNINQFVEAHPDVNRFDLVGLPLRLLPPSLDIDNYAILEVGRCYEGLDLLAQSEYSPR